MKIRHLAALAAGTLSLSGCWFIMIPLPRQTEAPIQTVQDGVDHGNDCVLEGTRVGQRVPGPGGKRGTVKALYGRSEKCPYGDFPIRAYVAPD